MANALTFELSKVEKPEIRERVVSHLVNVDTGLADAVAKGLGLARTPKASQAAVETRQDLKPSKALSIIQNGPGSFAGRKVGTLVTDGVDQALVTALRKALMKEGAMLEIISPKVGGVKASDGSLIEGDEKIGGGPSVLYDAVVIIPSKKEADGLAAMPPARDFAADAFAHCKYIGYVDAAAALFAKAGIADSLDGGCLKLNAKSVAEFVKQCRNLRYWEREGKGA